MVGLLATGCGTRLSDDQLKAANGGNGGGASTGGNSSSPSALGNGAVGTLKAPCGPRPKDAGPATAPSGVPGVTATTIRIGVVSDKAGAVPVPTVGIEESTKAFVKYCNDLGGVYGRKLELHAYDSQIFKTAEVTDQACKDNLFALVGDGSVQDQQGAQTRVDCGLVEVAAYGVTAERGLSDNFFSSVPNPGNHYNIGPCKYIAKQFPDAVKHASVIYSDLPSASDRAKALIEACTPEGFNFVYPKGVAPLFKDWGPVVSDMKDKGVEYVTGVTPVEDMSGLLRAMADQDFHPKVIDFGQQYYDPKLLADNKAEGAFVLTNTYPFEEQSGNPALQLYVKELKAVAPNVQPTSLGVQAFSAGLLFAVAASSLKDGLTRDSLAAALKGITSWDGGGLNELSNPGANAGGQCFLYMQVKNGKFVRHYPAKGFECDPSYDLALKGDYGTGAKKKGG